MDAKRKPHYADTRTVYPDRRLGFQHAGTTDGDLFPHLHSPLAVRERDARVAECHASPSGTPDGDGGPDADPAHPPRRGG